MTDDARGVTESEPQSSAMTRRALLRNGSFMLAASTLYGQVAMPGAGALAAAAARPSAHPLRATKPARLLVADALMLTPPLTAPFGRVRAIDDDTRMEVSTVTAASTTTLEATLARAPARYGIDCSTFPAGRNDQAALHESQQLFENSLLDFLGVYLAPAPNHSDVSWMRSDSGGTPYVKLLMNQGWAIVAWYVGLQQRHEKGGRYNLISAGSAAQQGTAHGHHAARLASRAQLPHKAVVFLDLELQALPIHPATLTYIDSWAAAVRADEYVPGVYCLSKVADAIHDHGRRLPLWVTRGPRSLNPLDSNLDVRPLAQRRLSAGADWGFVAYADGWQWGLRWKGVNKRLPRYLDTGVRSDWKLPGNEVDFDLANNPDPGRTAGGRSKAERRREIVSVDVSPATVHGGQQARLTLTLNGPAPWPDGTVVLIRHDVPDAIVVTSSVRVHPGARAAGTSLRTVPVNRTTKGTIAARALHQLSTPAALAKLTLTT
jgi:hypothetical protein